MPNALSINFSGIKENPVSPTPTLLSQNSPFFEEVVADHYDDVYRFALSLTGKECDAVDLTQNAFLKFARKGSSIREFKKAKSWLFSVLRNEFIDLKRKSTRFPTQELDPDFQCNKSSSNRSFDGETVLKTLATLPQPFQEVLALYYLKGHTYPEIASLLKIPIGTVMSRLSRGKAQLRQKLQPSLSYG